MYKNLNILNQLYFVLVLFFSFIVLIIDIVLPIQTLPALAYNLIVLMSAFLYLKRSYLYMTAFIGFSFTIIGLFLSPGDSSHFDSILIRALSAVFILLTAMICDKFLRFRNRAESLELETRILEKSNEQLEQFAFIASHDLQEPIRKIITFSDLLQKELEPNLNETQKKHFNFLTESSTRMRQLIHDLLSFSRAGNTEINPKKTDLNEIVQDILDRLKTTIQNSNAQINTTSLPTILCSPTLLTQVFENLITNSLKYQSSDSNPVIQISCKELKTFWEFHIQDNGIGVPSESRLKIFESFKRLHRKDEFEGTGIGLSICKRIIQRHGGKIWVESPNKKGSTFKFTLPK